METVNASIETACWLRAIQCCDRGVDASDCGVASLCGLTVVNPFVEGLFAAANDDASIRAAQWRACSSFLNTDIKQLGQSLCSGKHPSYHISSVKWDYYQNAALDKNRIIK